MRKKVLTLALSALLAANSSGACDDLFTVDREDVDRDGNTTYTVSLTEYARETPSDWVVVRLGNCFVDLMDSSPGMAAVVADGRHLTIHDALEMGEF